METTTRRAFSIAEALRFGWRTLKSNVNPLVIFGAAYALLALLQSAFQRGKAGLLALGVQVVQLVVMLAMTRVALQLHDGVKPDFSDKAKLVAGFGRYFLTALLYGLIVFGGFLLLVVPGFIWAMQFAFALFLTVEHGREPVEALKESSRLTRGHRWELFLFSLALAGINLVGAMLVGLGLIFTVPLSVLAMTYVYRRVQAHGPQEVGHPPLSLHPT